MKEFHEIANLFPLLAEESIEFKGMVESHKKVGLLEAITLLDNKILDGRNRERVCEKVGIEPRYEQFIGNDPFAFVAARNLHRRHLTTAQLAFIAAELVTMQHGGNRKSDQVSNSTLDRNTNAKAAKDLGIGETSVRTARRIKKDGIAEVVIAAKAAKINLNTADDISKLPKEDQSEALATKLAGKKGRIRKKPKAKQPKLTPYERELQVREKLGADKPIKWLTREEIEPGFKGSSVEFVARNGFVRLETREKHEASLDRMALGTIIGVLKKIKSSCKEMVGARRFPIETLSQWVDRLGPERRDERKALLIEMLDFVTQAGELSRQYSDWLKAGVNP